MHDTTNASIPAILRYALRARWKSLFTSDPLAVVFLTSGGTRVHIAEYRRGRKLPVI